MKSATSQVWVGDGLVGATLVVATANVEVAIPGVLVGGIVGGFRMAACVMLASTVWAAAVKAASGPCVGVAFDGKLQAEIPNMIMIRIEASRVVVDISLPPYKTGVTLVHFGIIA
jgi:hypothetical protein